MIPWMQTYTGRKFEFKNPQLESICINDIAHGLAMTCRYSGQCIIFYSVAEHSILMSESMLGNKKEALLHDAAEAYIGDIIAPLKWMIPEIKELEDNILSKIFEKFKLEWPMMPIVRDSVRHMDLAVRMMERKVLLGDTPSPWDIEGHPIMKVKIRGLLPYEARNLFLSRFYELF